jgi:hypothetical protein
MEEATCIIEEEFPEEFLHLDSAATIQNTDNQVGSVATEEVKVVEAMDAAPVDSGAGGGGLRAEVEGGPVLAPPPLSTLPDFCQAPPPFFHPEQLELVFELRNQMADQIHGTPSCTNELTCSMKPSRMHQQLNVVRPV